MNDRLQNLKQLCPVPIDFVDVIEANPYWAGVYFDDTHRSGYRHIEILNGLDDNQKIRTLIHEIGHALCDSKDCSCMKNPDHKQREIHAYKYTLKQLMKYKLKKELEAEITQIRQQANGVTMSDYYQTASKHVIELKLWQKCLDYIK